MTFSILARDPQTGDMGVATQSQAFAVGHSVPWAMAGSGAIATQSMGEPAYGQLGLDLLRAGVSAEEALIAVTSIDSHPERRQVAMVDVSGRMAAFTGSACIGAAGHRIAKSCVAVANMMESDRVWDAMVDAFERSRGPLASRLVAALRAAEAAGGDYRGRRSAAVRVVRAVARGRPWQDDIVDLRVEESDAPVDELERLVEKNARYNRMVAAFEQALNGKAREAAADIAGMAVEAAETEPDLLMWRAAILALAGRENDAVVALRHLQREAPVFVRCFSDLESSGLVDREKLWEKLLAAVDTK